MSRLSEIETFVAIADGGSLSEASRRTGVALSAVSRRLRDLETRLETVLVKRSTRRMSLTNEGQDFYIRCRRILADLEEAEAVMSDSGDGIAGRIRLGAPRGFGLPQLAASVIGFMKLHPKVSIDLDLTDRPGAPLDDAMDLGLRLGPVSDQGLVVKPLAPVRMLPFAAPELVGRLGTLQRPEDLGDLPLLTGRGTGEHRLWEFSRPDGSIGTVRAGGRMKCDDPEALAAAAEAGLGVALLPTHLAASAVTQGRLVPLFPDCGWGDIAAHAVFPTGRTMPRRVRALIDHLELTFGQEPVWDREIAASVASAIRRTSSPRTGTAG